MATVFKRGGRGNRSGKYYITYRNHTGRRVTRSARTTDKAAATRIASKLEADAALRRDGVIDPALDAIGRESQLAIDEHLTDYEAKLRSAGRTERHIEDTIRYIRKIATAAQWQTAAGISADAVHRFAGNLFLDATQPYVTCKAGNTKNRKLAKQYIGRDLAEALATHVATKSPSAPMFAMPHRYDVAAMLRDDLADARRQWLAEAKLDPAERLRREQSDFLTEENHDGQRLDFHALRHTCGAWLAMQGAHPKLIQTVMRHSSITLTMDTYGHLFPGQEAEAATSMADLLTEQVPGPETALATGTDDRVILLADLPQEKAQRAGREATQHDAMAHETNRANRKPQPFAGCGFMRRGATRIEAEGTGLEPATLCRAPEFQSGR